MQQTFKSSLIGQPVVIIPKCNFKPVQMCWNELGWSVVLVDEHKFYEKKTKNKTTQQLQMFLYLCPFLHFLLYFSPLIIGYVLIGLVVKNHTHNKYTNAQFTISHQKPVEHSVSSVLFILLWSYDRKSKVVLGEDVLETLARVFLMLTVRLGQRHHGLLPTWH